MEDLTQIRVGQVFKCKRRGHLVKVEIVNLDRDFVYYRNTRNQLVSISPKRLLNKSRFEQIVEPAILHPQEQEV